MIRTTADFETAKANGEVWPVGDAAGKHWTDGFAVYNEAGENVGYITAAEGGITEPTGRIVIEYMSLFTKIGMFVLGTGYLGKGIYDAYTQKEIITNPNAAATYEAKAKADAAFAEAVGRSIAISLLSVATLAGVGFLIWKKR